MVGSKLDLADSRLREYEVLEQIGKGAFGEVWIIQTRRHPKHRFVLKKVKLARQSERQRFMSRQEMHLVAALRHPFVVPYHSSWIERTHTICIVMRYCDGGDLGTLLHKATSRGARFLEPQLHLWLAQLLMALSYLHSKRVIHRDVKSGNVFLTADDFGLAKVVDEKKLASSSSSSSSSSPGDGLATATVGTPSYMCPEIISGQPYGFASDIWSLGCVMYELSTLRQAFQAFNIEGLKGKILKSSPPPIPSGEYSGEWCGAVRSMLRKQSSTRPTADEMLGSQFLAGGVGEAEGRRRALEAAGAAAERGGAAAGAGPTATQPAPAPMPGPGDWSPRLKSSKSSDAAGAGAKAKTTRTRPPAEAAAAAAATATQAGTKEGAGDGTGGVDAASGGSARLAAAAKRQLQIGGGGDGKYSYVSDGLAAGKNTSALAQPANTPSKVGARRPRSASPAAVRLGGGRGGGGTQGVYHKQTVRGGGGRGEGGGGAWGTRVSNTRAGGATTTAASAVVLTEFRTGKQTETSAAALASSSSSSHVQLTRSGAGAGSQPAGAGSTSAVPVDAWGVPRERRQRDAGATAAAAEDTLLLTDCFDDLGEPPRDPPDGTSTEKEAGDARTPFSTLQTQVQRRHERQHRQHHAPPSEASIGDGWAGWGGDGGGGGGDGGTPSRSRSLSLPLQSSLHPSPRSSSGSPLSGPPTPTLTAPSPTAADTSGSHPTTADSILRACAALHAGGRSQELAHLLSNFAPPDGQAAAGIGGGSYGQTVRGEAAAAALELGHEVVVGRSEKVRGVIRYLGPTAFADGEWVGIELGTARGKNDGEVDGVSYFACGAGRGLFVRSSVLRPRGAPDSG